MQSVFLSATLVLLRILNIFPGCLPLFSYQANRDNKDELLKQAEIKSTRDKRKERLPEKPVQWRFNRAKSVKSFV